MNRITFDLRSGMTGAGVADLQDALRLLVDKGTITLTEAQRKRLMPVLATERASGTYADVTAKLVAVFQERSGLGASGSVDERTAAALNDALGAAGAFGTPTATDAFVVAGRVVDEDGNPLAGVRVAAMDVRRTAAIRLGGDESDSDGRYTVTFDALPDKAELGVQVVATAADGRMLAQSDVVKPAEAVLVVDLLAKRPVEARATARLEGVVVREDGGPAAGLTLRLYRSEFGKDPALIRTTTTSSAGRYAFTFEPGIRGVTLQVRAHSRRAGEVALSKPMHRMGIDPVTVVTLVAPNRLQPAAAEYERLVAALAPQAREQGALAGLKESGDRRDLTQLHTETGWDARLIALAATAEKLHAQEEGLPAEALYGLFRAGLPTDRIKLAQTDPRDVAKALKHLREAGIVALSDPQIAAFRESFGAFANRTRLSLPAPGSRTTYAELLDAAGIGDDAARFAPVLVSHRGSAQELWGAARRAGVSETAIGRLKWQGKLSFLAGHSGPVVEHLMATLSVPAANGVPTLRSPAELVARDLYEPEGWEAELLEMAGGDDAALGALIPAAYTGEAVGDRVAAYAEDLARKIRLSYPTEVVARLVEKDELKVENGQATLTMLRAATAKGFKLGAMPVEAFLVEREVAPAGLSPAQQAAGREGLKALQRIYQITPNTPTMVVLAALGLTAAYDVTALREDAFSALFTAKYTEIHARPPTSAEVTLVWRKAQQVSSMTYNLYGSAKTLISVPAVPVISGTPQQRAAATSQLQDALKRYPTMESLFGSMDYCECEHCRSVLSPAAYLVDLLQFVEGEPQAWANFLADWQLRNGTAYTADFTAPYEALVTRRPDLAHIPLTCENTNVAMPYIDLVNEILEYHVAHGHLEAAAARDTGDATTAELLAEPQHVVEQAYHTLRGAKYPLALPFDLWLETVREFCAYAGTPLAEVLEEFRVRDDLLAAPPGYDRATTFIESLGISAAERQLFANPTPLADWWTLYGYTSAASATTPAVDPSTGQRIDLNSAKALARRLGVSYKQLAQLVTTRFVNPGRDALALVGKLGATVAEAQAFADPANQVFLTANRDLLGDTLNAAQQTRKAALSDTDWQRLADLGALASRIEEHAARYGSTPAQVTAAVQATPFGTVLVLADPEAGCDFDATILRYADGEAADAAAFTRLHLFVRLRRTLGWSIEETDRALAVLVPSATPYDPAHYAAKPLEAALVHLAHLKALEGRVSLGKQARAKLLTLWSDLPIAGASSLYAQLFLTHSVLKSDPIFDHPDGDYLDPAWVAQQGVGKPADFVLIRGHLTALGGALGLTSDDIRAILADSGATLESAGLTLANVSLLYRYAVLAKGLKVTVGDLITLRALTGRNPFAPIPAQPPTTLADDHLFSEALAFVDQVQQVRTSGFTVDTLSFLFRRWFDEAGPNRIDRPALLALLRTLADGVRAIEAAHGLPAAPSVVGEDFLRAELGLLLEPAAVDRLLRMLRGAETLDATTKLFFDDQLATRTLRPGQVAGFLPPSEYPALFAPLAPLDPILATDTPAQVTAKQVNNAQVEVDNRAALQARHDRVAAAALPVTRNRLVRQFVVQTIAAQAPAGSGPLDPVLVEALVTDERLLHADDPAKPLVAPISAAAGAGIDADFFTSSDLSGLRLPTPAQVASADTALKAAEDAVGNPIPAAGSARFAGYVVTPVSGAYRFSIQLDRAGARAALVLPHLPEPQCLAGTAAADHAELGGGTSEFVELKAGVPYRFELALRDLGGGGGRLLVQCETSARGPLSQYVLYPAAAFGAAEGALEQLRSAQVLVSTLGLTEPELRHLLLNRHDFGGPDLSDLPIAPIPDTAPARAAASVRFGWFLRLAAYVRLRDEVAGGGPDLIEVFRANATAEPNRLVERVFPLLATLTRREAAEVQSVAEALYPVAGSRTFPNEVTVGRLWRALRIVGRLGATAPAVRGWTDIVLAATGNTRRFEIAREVRETVRARFDEATWHRVAQPISDRLRRRQRDALTAHIIHTQALDGLSQLYEYFLVDPGMEPVVQTSRIRMAISTVQLFIQRCLLNLEADVHPSAILNADQWDWMKRYRVWEANRKIFLFPENWLEPEFRDEKSHLFTELEGALLSDDVTPDLVEDAFLGYLTKLSQLARLEIVAMHLETRPDWQGNILHVFGRTFGEPHEYFYRRYANAKWSAWEPVGLEIAGDHLAPAVWRNRLYLFWVTFATSAQASTVPTSVDTASAIPLPELQRFVEAQLHWSEYSRGGWSTPESSGYASPTDLRIAVEVSADFKPENVFVHVDVRADPTPGQETAASISQAGVYVHLGDPVGRSFHLVSRNAEARPADYESPWAPPFTVDSTLHRATQYVGRDHLQVVFRQRIVTETETTSAMMSAVAVFPQPVLAHTGRFTLLPPDNRVVLGVSAEALAGSAHPTEVRAALEASMAEIASLVRPFFFQDDAYALYVEPEVRERTVEEWQEYVPPTPGPGTDHPFVDPDWWQRFVRPEYYEPLYRPPHWDPPNPDWRSVIQDVRVNDWLTNPVTVLLFDGSVIGEQGSLPVAQVDAGEVARATAQGAVVVPVAAGSQLAAGTVLVAAGERLTAQTGTRTVATGVAIVGGDGFNSQLQQAVASTIGGAAGQATFGFES